MLAAALSASLVASAGPASAQSADDKMKSNLRNLATMEETYFVDHYRYGTATQLKADGYHLRLAAGQIINVHVSAQAYCLAGRVSPRRFYLFTIDKGGVYGPRSRDACSLSTYPRSSGRYSG